VRTEEDGMGDRFSEAFGEKLTEEGTEAMSANNGDEKMSVDEIYLRALRKH
jgi:hypothetical protein